MLRPTNRPVMIADGIKTVARLNMDILPSSSAAIVSCVIICVIAPNMLIGSMAVK